jgi:hypothetical protein
LFLHGAAASGLAGGVYYERSLIELGGKIMGQPYVGEIRLVGFNFAPVGWAFCNGQIMAISENTALFTLIGTTYGGMAGLCLPNLQSRLSSIRTGTRT